MFEVRQGFKSIKSVWHIRVTYTTSERLPAKFPKCKENITEVWSLRKTNLNIQWIIVESLETSDKSCMFHMLEKYISIFSKSSCVLFAVPEASPFDLHQTAWGLTDTISINRVFRLTYYSYKWLNLVDMNGFNYVLFNTDWYRPSSQQLGKLCNLPYHGGKWNPP